MYKYEYETVSCDFGGWGLGSGNVYRIEDIAPTIAALLGAEPAPEWEGKNLL